MFIDPRTLAFLDRAHQPSEAQANQAFHRELAQLPWLRRQQNPANAV